MENAIDAYHETSFKEWCVQRPGQVILAASNVYWTCDVTEVSFSSLSHAQALVNVNTVVDDALKRGCCLLWSGVGLSG